jgi:uncharacterized RDD family membrane protein YckC
MVVVSRPEAGLKPADQHGPRPVLPVAESPSVAPRCQLLAGWGFRVWAGIIDLLPFLGAYGIERVVVATAGPGWRWIALPFDYAAPIWMIYNQYRAGVTGQSLGKRVVGLRLVRSSATVARPVTLSAVRVQAVNATPRLVPVMVS